MKNYTNPNSDKSDTDKLMANGIRKKLKSNKNELLNNKQSRYRNNNS